MAIEFGNTKGAHFISSFRAFVHDNGMPGVQLRKDDGSYVDVVLSGSRHSGATNTTRQGITDGKLFLIFFALVIMSNSTLSLQLANSALRKEVVAFKKEIGKLQTQNAKLKAEKESDRAEISALKKLKVTPPATPMSTNEIARRIAFVLRQGSVGTSDNS